MTACSGFFRLLIVGSEPLACIVKILEKLGTFEFREAGVGGPGKRTFCVSLMSTVIVDGKP